MVKDVRKFLFNKLFLPKVIVIDQPGIIISKTTQRYGGGVSRRRMVYDFEDILSGLQLETVKKLGERKASDLFYKVGKGVGAQYGYFARNRKIPLFSLPSFLDYLFSTLSSVGFSFGNKVHYDARNKSLILRGHGSLVCRKTGNASMFAGLASGVLSSFLGENIEAEAKCKCPYCHIEANKKIAFKFIPDMEKISPIKNYDSLNFPSNLNHPPSNSFKDLIHFKKIQIDNSGKFSFLSHTLFFSEISMLSFLAESYLPHSKKILESSVVTCSERLSSELFRGLGRSVEKIHLLNNTLSVFGWGIPFYKKKQGKIIFKFLHSPVSRNGFLYQALELNGYLNFIFGRKFKIKELKTTYNPVVTSIVYEA